MLKIGDFSKLACITVKTLRYYDRLGLLKPVWIDRYTGYRYYNLDQLPRLNRILALKEMGFSLGQVRSLLAEDLPVEQLRQLFDQKQRELQQRLSQEQSRLSRVAERLQQIEQEGSLPEYEVVLKAVPPQVVASLRGRVGSEDGLAAFIQQSQQGISRWVELVRLRGLDQWLVLHHNREYRRHDLDVEVALVLEDHTRSGEALQAATDAAAPVVKRWLPGAEWMASLLQPAGSRTLQTAYSMLFQWAERNRYFPYGPARQVLLTDPEHEEPSLVEVQVPVESTAEVKQKLYLNPYRKENEMEPEFVSLPAFDVVGVRYYGNNQHQEISGLWGEFNRRAGEIRHVKPDSDAFGLCVTVPEAASGEFEYVASFQVDRPADVPEGMVSRHIPAHKYAVFTHIGSLEKLRDTYHYIYQVWLPQSGFKVVNGIDFELYNEEFKDFAPDSRFYIYVPIE